MQAGLMVQRSNAREESSQFLTRFVVLPEYPFVIRFHGRSEGAERVTYVTEAKEEANWGGPLGLFVHLLLIGTPPHGLPDGLWPGTILRHRLASVLDSWFAEKGHELTPRDYKPRGTILELFGRAPLPRIRLQPAILAEGIDRKRYKA